MSDSVHLLIPFASCTAPGCAQALGALSLPRLNKLLARLTPGPLDSGDEHSLSMPHERVLARANGLPVSDGAIPWAAWEAAQAGRDPQNAAWAWITPCHWRVGRDHVVMDPPQNLALGERESRTLLDAMHPYFEQDGIALEYEAPTRWLARGELFRDLPTASLDRVAGRVIDAWIPRAPQARTLRRLQQEMQMLLYTHETNEARSHGGLLPVNSFWASGTGALPPGHAAAPPAGLQIIHTLRDAALVQDWHGWAAAWQQLDAVECARLGAALDAGQVVTVSLCGERSAQSWSSTTPVGWPQRLARLIQRTNAASVLQGL